MLHHETSDLEASAIRLFRERYRANPTVLARAPGRVELLGNHTDYNGGVVMSAAIDRYTVVVGRPLNESETGRIYAQAFDEELCIDSHMSSVVHPAGSWKRYVQGVSDLFSGKVRSETGAIRWGRSSGIFTQTAYEGVIAGDIPLGTGLSSSASLEAAFAFFMHKLEEASGFLTSRFRTDADLMDLARDLRDAENTCVGVPCGLLDQFSVIMGRAGHALFLDCATEEFERLPLGESPPALIICDTRTSRALAEGQYRRRREECERVLRYFQEFREVEELSERQEAEPRSPLGKFWKRWIDRRDWVAEEQALRPKLTSLSRIKLEQLEEHWNRLDPTGRKRARHVLTENLRVQRGVEALHRGDVQTLGKLMLESHRSSREDFENSSEALDAMLEAAEESPGFLGGKLSGAGWAGCTVNLVRARLAEDFADEVRSAYARRTGITPNVHICHATDGVCATLLLD